MSQPPPPPGPPPGPVPGESPGTGEATGPSPAPGSRGPAGPPESPPSGGGFGPPPPPSPPPPPPAAPQDSPPPPTSPAQNPPPTPPPASATPPEQAYSPPGAPPPPGDGFGTPLSPAQSAPTPAGEPGTPGYGYPPAGYGYPQSGYGYPSSPYPDAGPGGPPHHGAPTGGMGPVVPPGGKGGSGGSGSSGNRGPLLVVLVGVVVAALVAGGFGLWHVTQDGDSGPDSAQPVEGDDESGDSNGSDEAPPPLPDEPREAELLHSEVQGDVDDFHSFETSWVAGDLVIRPAPGRVVATDITSGDEAWVHEMENRGNCSASPGQSEGRIALLEGRDCEQLTVLDLNSGEVVWTTPLPEEHSTTPGNRDRPAILGDYVALAWTPGGFGWNISQEQLLWEPDVSDSCAVTDYGVLDGAFVESGICGTEWTTSNPGYVRGTTPEGEETWRWDYEAEHEGEELYVHNVLDTDPLVAMVTLGDSGVVEGTTEFWVLDEHAEEVAAVLDHDPDRQSYDCAYWDGIVGCAEVVSHEGYLYMSNRDADQGVSVFDLGSGNEIYRAEPVVATGGQLIPFDAVGEQVLVYQRPRGTEPGSVLAVDPETEELAEVLVMTHDTADVEGPPGSGWDTNIIWDDNRLFLVDGVFMEDNETDTQVAVFG